MVASVITVRAGCRPGPVTGVAWVSTTLPAPSPERLVMQIVRASGQANSARTGTASHRDSRKDTSSTSRSTELAASSTVRSLKA